MTPPLQLLFVWRGLGPVHVARMNALASRPEVDLTVVARHERETGAAWPSGAGAGEMPMAFKSVSWAQAIGRRAPASDLSHLDAIVIPGWYETELIALARRVPRTSLRLIYSVSNAHDRPRSRWRERIKRWRLAPFDGALVAGRASAEYVRSLGMPAERVAEVGNVSDPAPFAAAREAAAPDSHASAPSTPSISSTPPDTRPILFVGRLAPEKNVASLIEAFARSADEPEFRGRALVLIGDGPERAGLERSLPDSLRPRVQFLGALSPADVAAQMARCAFLALPSATEPWGLVVNEAMHSGRPVLLTPACGCLGELGRPGVSWVAGGEDVDSLAEALRRAMADAPCHDAMGARAAALAENFTPDTFAAHVVEAVMRLVALARRS